MLRSFARACARARAAAIPICAALVFTLGWAGSPAPDGSLGVAAAEAGNGKAKGGKGGSKKLKAAKSDRKGGKKDRTARSKGGKKDRTAKSGGGKKDRTARTERKADKAERTAKTDRQKGKRTAAQDQETQAAGTDQETARLDSRDEEEARQDYWDRQDDRYDDDGDGYAGDGLDDHDAPADGDEVVTKRNWGATASQLKHRNAANANENAFRNASPNSNVGRIATYREAARQTIDKEQAIGDMDRRLEELEQDRLHAAADGDLEALEEIEAEIGRIEDDRMYAVEDLDDLRLAEDEAYQAVGGPELDEHDYGVFRRMLGL